MNARYVRLDDNLSPDRLVLFGRTTMLENLIDVSYWNSDPDCTDIQFIPLWQS